MSSTAANAHASNGMAGLRDKAGAKPLAVPPFSMTISH